VSGLEGYNALITGGGRGIGAAAGIALARAGVKVSLAARNEEQVVQIAAEIRKEGYEAFAFRCDVTDERQVRDLVMSASDAMGRVDILINNAGILRDRMLVNMSEKEWDDVIQVHLKGTFAPSRHAAAYWREESKKIGGPIKGRIINTSSTSGLYGNVGQTNYGAAKAGIAAFTIIAARELARIGVTVNALSPSAQTRMTEGLRELTPEQRESRDPAWVSPTVVYLCSEEAQDITGRVFQAGFGRIAVLEGWRRGDEAPQTRDPREAGRLFRAQLKKVRKNVGMDGLDLD